MADISITAANVLKGTANTVENGTAGETITAGQTVYKKSTDSLYYLGDCSAAAVSTLDEVKEVYGIALNNAAVNQTLQVQKTGDITIGGTVTAGTVYYLSETAGGIAPIDDLISTNWHVIIGVATSASVLHLLIYDVNVQEA